MNRHLLPFATLSFIGLLVIASSAPVHAELTCQDLEYGNAKHGEAMDALARRAKLPDGAWNRYHESVVAGLCAGKREEVRRLIDDGAVSGRDVERIARALGKPYAREKQTDSGKRYASARAKFAEMGACASCADNIAQYYVHKPGTRCGKLATRAVAGDAEAIDALVEFPEYCEWKY